MAEAHERAIAKGVLLAVAAACAFGVTTPIVAWAGRELGALTTAALLYAGAALAAFVLGAFAGRSDAPLRRGDVPRVVAVALLGGALAPTLLAWGLQHVGATLGALVLNLEAVFTVLLARAVYREPIGGRVALAVCAMVAGGAALALDASRGGGWSALGLAAIAGATLAWAGDNTLTRVLAERDPLHVVAAKGALGAACTAIAALALAEPKPQLLPMLALLACGATGYGVSLRLYLLAQRRVGAARTGSVFALAPFIGAAVAFALGDRAAGPWSVTATTLFGVGLVLHATEHHGHAHVHHAVDHEHPHRHDDGHHLHDHDPPVAGEHSHRHRHDHLEHAHEHAPDVHHEHVH
ncbi:MAG TPA: DMT family transporter [Kofleriaceae bacterium]|nr:DMT family transporter [Kofleriaceae bacterium]